MLVVPLQGVCRYGNIHVNWCRVLADIRFTSSSNGWYDGREASKCARIGLGAKRGRYGAFYLHSLAAACLIVPGSATAQQQRAAGVPYSYVALPAAGQLYPPGHGEAAESPILGRGLRGQIAALNGNLSSNTLLFRAEACLDLMTFLFDFSRAFLELRR